MLLLVRRCHCPTYVSSTMFRTSRSARHIPGRGRRILAQCSRETGPSQSLSGCLDPSLQPPPSTFTGDPQPISGSPRRLGHFVSPSLLVAAFCWFSCTDRRNGSGCSSGVRHWRLNSCSYKREAVRIVSGDAERNSIQIRNSADHHAVSNDHAGTEEHAGKRRGHIEWKVRSVECNCSCGGCQCSGAALSGSVRLAADTRCVARHMERREEGFRINPPTQTRLRVEERATSITIHDSRWCSDRRSVLDSLSRLVSRDCYLLQCRQ